MSRARPPDGTSDDRPPDYSKVEFRFGTNSIPHFSSLIWDSLQDLTLQDEKVWDAFNDLKGQYYRVENIIDRSSGKEVVLGGNGQQGAWTNEDVEIARRFEEAEREHVRVLIGMFDGNVSCPGTLGEVLVDSGVFGDAVADRWRGLGEEREVQLLHLSATGWVVETTRTVRVGRVTLLICSGRGCNICAHADGPAATNDPPASAEPSVQTPAGANTEPADPQPQTLRVDSAAPSETDFAHPGGPSIPTGPRQQGKFKTRYPKRAGRANRFLQARFPNGQLRPVTASLADLLGAALPRPDGEGGQEGVELPTTTTTPAPITAATAAPPLASPAPAPPAPTTQHHSPQHHTPQPPLPPSHPTLQLRSQPNGLSSTTLPHRPGVPRILLPPYRSKSTTPSHRRGALRIAQVPYIPPLTTSSAPTLRPSSAIASGADLAGIAGRNAALSARAVPFVYKSTAVNANMAVDGLVVVEKAVRPSDEEALRGFVERKEAWERGLSGNSAAEKSFVGDDGGVEVVGGEGKEEGGEEGKCAAVLVVTGCEALEVGSREVRECTAIVEQTSVATTSLPAENSTQTTQRASTSTYAQAATSPRPATRVALPLPILRITNPDLPAKPVAETVTAKGEIRGAAGKKGGQGGASAAAESVASEIERSLPYCALSYPLAKSASAAGPPPPASPPAVPQRARRKRPQGRKSKMHNVQGGPKSNDNTKTGKSAQEAGTVAEPRAEAQDVPAEVIETQTTKQNSRQQQATPTAEPSSNHHTPARHTAQRRTSPVSPSAVDFHTENARLKSRRFQAARDAAQSRQEAKNPNAAPTRRVLIPSEPIWLPSDELVRTWDLPNPQPVIIKYDPASYTAAALERIRGVNAASEGILERYGKGKRILLEEYRRERAKGGAEWLSGGGWQGGGGGDAGGPSTAGAPAQVSASSLPAPTSSETSRVHRVPTDLCADSRHPPLPSISASQLSDAGTFWHTKSATVSFDGASSATVAAPPGSLRPRLIARVQGGEIALAKCKKDSAVPVPALPLDQRASVHSFWEGRPTAGVFEDGEKTLTWETQAVLQEELKKRVLKPEDDGGNSPTPLEKPGLPGTSKPEPLVNPSWMPPASSRVSGNPPDDLRAAGHCRICNSHLEDFDSRSASRFAHATTNEYIASQRSYIDLAAKANAPASPARPKPRRTFSTTSVVGDAPTDTGKTKTSGSRQGSVLDNAPITGTTVKTPFGGAKSFGDTREHGDNTSSAIGAMRSTPGMAKALVPKPASVLDGAAITGMAMHAPLVISGVFSDLREPGWDVARPDSRLLAERSADIAACMAIWHFKASASKSVTHHEAARDADSPQCAAAPEHMPPCSPRLGAVSTAPILESPDHEQVTPRSPRRVRAMRTRREAPRAVSSGCSALSTSDQPEVVSPVLEQRDTQSLPQNLRSTPILSAPDEGRGDCPENARDHHAVRTTHIEHESGTGRGGGSPIGRPSAEEFRSSPTLAPESLGRGATPDRDEKEALPACQPHTQLKTLRPRTTQPTSASVPSSTQPPATSRFHSVRDAALSASSRLISMLSGTYDEIEIIYMTPRQGSAAGTVVYDRDHGRKSVFMTREAARETGIDVPDCTFDRIMVIIWWSVSVTVLVTELVWLWTVW